jgi:hypothetical protein
MPSSDEENLTKRIEELKKAREEYSNTSEDIIRTLKELKKSQKEYIGLIKEHQEYWRNELEKTEYQNTSRRKKLEKTLEHEERILEKFKRALNRTDERIEFHKKRNGH